MNQRYDYLLLNEIKYNKTEMVVILYNKLMIDLNIINKVYLDLKDEYLDDFKCFLSKDLEYSYKYLKSNNLETRISGISFLSNLCVNIENNQIFSQYDNYQEIIELKKECFLNFLFKIDFYNLIFGENIHEAILSRASPLLVFLYKNNKLSSEDITNLWKFYQEKHQSIGESILKVFSELIHVFSNEHSNFVLKIISDMNYKDIN